MKEEQRPGPPVVIITARQLAHGYYVMGPDGREHHRAWVVLAKLDDGRFEVEAPEELR